MIRTLHTATTTLGTLLLATVALAACTFTPAANEKASLTQDLEVLPTGLLLEFPTTSPEALTRDLNVRTKIAQYLATHASTFEGKATGSAASRRLETLRGYGMSTAWVSNHVVGAATVLGDKGENPARAIGLIQRNQEPRTSQGYAIALRPKRGPVTPSNLVILPVTQSSFIEHPNQKGRWLARLHVKAPSHITTRALGVSFGDIATGTNTAAALWSTKDGDFETRNRSFGYQTGDTTDESTFTVTSVPPIYPSLVGTPYVNNNLEIVGFHIGTHGSGTNTMASALLLKPFQASITKLMQEPSPVLGPIPTPPSIPTPQGLVTPTVSPVGTLISTTAGEAGEGIDLLFAEATATYQAHLRNPTDDARNLAVLQAWSASRARANAVLIPRGGIVNNTIHFALTTNPSHWVGQEGDVLAFVGPSASRTANGNFPFMGKVTAYATANSNDLTLLMITVPSNSAPVTSIWSAARKPGKDDGRTYALRGTTHHGMEYWSAIDAEGIVAADARIHDIDNLNHDLLPGALVAQYGNNKVRGLRINDAEVSLDNKESTERNWITCAMKHLVQTLASYDTSDRAPSTAVNLNCN